jgi:uncharacterized membrane protein YqgA involved in biofilm formation
MGQCLYTDPYFCVFLYSLFLALSISEQPKRTSMNVLLSLSLALNFLAQQPDSVEMADRLRADGKIWVVVLVIAVVFAGIITYLIRLDRQLNKVEKEVQRKRLDKKPLDAEL